MTVAFNRTPTNLRVPFFYAEVNSGANYYEGNSKLLLICQFLAGAATATAKGGNAGNGTIALAAAPVLASGQLGTYKAVFSSATAFTVTDPDGNAVGSGVVGTAFAAQIAFTIAAGATPFAANDEFDIKVTQLAPQCQANVPMLASGSAAAGIVGAGSMLADMIAWARQNYSLGEIWVLPLADPAGVAAAATMTPVAPGTSGTYAFYVNGQRIEVGVLSTDTAAMIGANIAAAINEGYLLIDGTGMSLPVTASANPATGVVTATSRHTGTMGNFNSIDIGLDGDDGALMGMCTIVNFGAAQATLGTGTPSLTAALAACGDTQFDWIGLPYSDTASLNALRSFLSDSGGRWDPTVQIYGHAVSVNFGNLSAQSTLGAGRNDPHVTIMGVQQSSSPPWQWAAAIGGQLLLHKNLGADIADAGEISRPMQTIVLNGIRAPNTRGQRWQRGDRQTLYYDGISAFTVTSDGQVALDRLVTTYQSNAWAQPDSTWLDIETLAQTTYGLRYMNQYITQKHPRDAYVGDNPTALQGFTTNSDLKADLIHAYKALETGGIFKNSALFAQNVVVETAGDPNRANAYLPFDVVNQLRIFAANATVFLNAAATN